MKKIFTLLFTSAASLLLVACSANGSQPSSTSKTETETMTTVAETTTTASVEEVSETYKMTQEEEGVIQDIFIDITYTADNYKSLALRYETQFDETILPALQSQGREAVEANFNENLDGLIPGVNSIKEMEGVDVISTVDDNFVWKLTITMDPNVVDFEELASKGDSFSFLADMSDIKPKQLIAGFSIVGFKKVSE